MLGLFGLGNGSEKRKAQVSIFVIIGVIIVISAAFFFLNSKFEVFQFGDSKAKAQFSKVVSDCVEEKALLGVYLLGQQGGVLEIPKVKLVDPRNYANLGVKVMNWDTETGSFPTIESMQGELDRFVAREAYSCVVSGLKGFEGVYEYELGDESSFVVESSINSNNVVLETSFEIRFNEVNSEEVLVVSDYVSELEDLPLGDLYELAIQIYGVEKRSYVFEDLIVDQIYSANDYSSVDSMPSEGMFMSCGKKIWSVPQLKKNLVNLNNNNFRYMYFEGTRAIDERYANLNVTGDYESFKKFYDLQYTFFLDDVKSSYKNYDVAVFVPSSEFTGRTGYFESGYFRGFEVTPSSGNIVTSMDMNFGSGDAVTFPVPCVQVMHHLYSLDYDLIVRLTDFGGESGDEYQGRFVFQFPVRVVVDKNEPKKNVLGNVPTYQPLTFNREEYCRENLSRKYPLSVVAEDLDGNALSSVNVSFSCMSFKCDIGSVERSSQTRNPILQGVFPFCVNGKIWGEKEGYFGVKDFIDVDSSVLAKSEFEVASSVVLKMAPVKKFSIDSRKLRFDPVVYSGGACPTDSKVSESIIYLVVENRGLGFKSEVVYPKQEFLPASLELLDVPGIAYNVSLIYMDQDSNLKGILEFENYVFDVNSDAIVFRFLASANGLSEPEQFVSYYDEQQALVSSNGLNKCMLPFGIISG